MDFQHYHTIADSRVPSGYGHLSREEFYDFVCARNRDIVGLIGVEHAWYSIRRPYFRVWPKIIPILSRVDLSKVKGRDIQLPKPSLGFSIADEEYEGISVKPFLVSETSEPGQFAVFVNSDYMPEVRRVPCNPGGAFVVHPDQSVSEGLEVFNSDLGKVADDPERFDSMALLDKRIRLSMKIALSVCLMDDLIDQIVVSKDYQKWKDGDEEVRRRLERRADKVFKGRQGWDVGRELENNPHWRNPHFAIRWTGKGGKIPKLRPIKGSIVHRQKVQLEYMDSK